MTDEGPIYQVRKLETCKACKGTGWIWDPHCEECGRKISEKEMAVLDRNNELPCGHPVNRLLEEYRCTECEDGKIESWISLEQALRELHDSQHPALSHQ